MRVLQLLFPLSALGGPFSISNVFGDHMVLQRDTPANIFGFADPGVVATTVFQGIKVTSAPADANRTWTLALPAQPVTRTPQVITITSSDGQNAVLNDVLFGDVHICGGQSNSEFISPLSPIIPLRVKS